MYTQIFNVYVWSELELALGIMCASAPSMRLFFRTHLHEPITRLRQPSASHRRKSIPRVARNARCKHGYDDIELAEKDVEKGGFFGSPRHGTVTTTTVLTDGTDSTKQSQEERQSAIQGTDPEIESLTPVLLQSWHYTEAGDGRPQDNIIIDDHNRSWLQ